MTATYVLCFSLCYILILVPSASPPYITISAMNTSILIKWQPLPLEQQNGIIQKYHVTVYAPATNQSQLLETNETRIEVAGLHPFYLYEVTVSAESGAGVGPESQPVLQQLPEASEDEWKPTA